LYDDNFKYVWYDAINLKFMKLKSNSKNLHYQIFTVVKDLE
jgi:hypothetical protein